MSRRRRSSLRRQSRSFLFPAAIGLVLLGGIVLIAVSRDGGKAPATPPPPPAGVRSFEDLKSDHVEGEVDYEVIPPVGGPHHPVPQTCGFYDEPVRTENAVHSMEHGAVWITYDPDLSRSEIDSLRELGGTKVLISPWPDLEDPVVASAWGRQLKVDSVDDPRLSQFIGAFTNGQQSPEPLAACQGISEPR